MNVIEEYNKLIKKLWDDLELGEITEEEYYDVYDTWMKKNGNLELFDYLLDKYKNTKVEKMIINYKNNFDN